MLVWILFCVLLPCDRLRAASGTWLGTTDANWASAGNWSASPVPGTGDSATFSGAGNGNTTLSLGAGGITIKSVVFDSASVAAYTIGSGGVGAQTLTLETAGGLSLTASVALNQTVNAALKLGPTAVASTHTIANAAPGRTLTLAGPLAGGTGGTGAAKTLTFTAGSAGPTPAVIDVPAVIGGGGGTIAVTASGSGTLVLGGTNTFTGALSISSGTLSIPTINNSAAAGPLGNSTGAVTLVGATLLYTGPTATSTKRFSITAPSVSSLTIANAATELTLSGVIDGAYISKDGPGTLVLGGANTHDGLFHHAGTVRLSGTGTPCAATGYLSLADRFDLNGRSITVGLLDGTLASRIVNDGTGTATLTESNNEISFSGGVLTVGAYSTEFKGIVADNDNGGAGVVALRKTGPGELVLSGVNTYTGLTTISVGTLAVQGNGTLGDTATATTVASGATLGIYGANLVGEPVSLAGAGVVLAGYGPLTNGALVGAGTASFSGPLTLTAAATVNVSAGGNFTLAGPISGAFALTLSADDAGFSGAAGLGTISSAIGTGTGAVTKTGAGTWTLSGSNTFTGVLTIAAGTLSIATFNNASTAGPLGNSANAVTFNQAVSGDPAPRLLYTGPTASSSKRLASADFADLNVSSTATELTLSGVVSGAGNFQKSGPGTLTFTAVNTYVGTIVAGGTLRLSGSGRLGATTGALLMFGSGSRLDLGGTSQTVADLTTSNGTTIVNNAGGASLLTINTATSNSTLAGLILDNDNGSGGTVSLAKSGAGSLIVSAANTYTGSTSITDGTLTVSGNGTLGSATGVRSVSSGATLTLGNPPSTVVQGDIVLAGAGDVSGGRTAALEGFGATYAGLLSLSANATVAATNNTFNLTNTGTILGSGFTLTLTGNANGFLASAIGTGTGGLTKNGTGTWTLTNGSTYTGATTINAGILNIRHNDALGAGAGATSIVSGATLQVQGGVTVPEAVTVRGVGAAGTSGALQNLSGNNTWSGPITLGANATIASDAGLFSLTNAGNLGGAFDLIVTGDGDGLISSAIAIGLNNVTKSGNGTWTLSGTNTFTGALTVASGNLSVPVANNASTTGPLGNRAAGVVLGATGGSTGTLAYTGTTASTTKPFTLATGGNGAFQVDNAGTSLTLSGVVSGAGNLVKSGPGTLVLGATNTYTGSTTVAGGILTVNQAVLPNAADVNLATGATLNLAFAGSDTIGQLRIDGLLQSSGSWGGPTSAATYKTSLISGPGTLNVSAGATLPPFASWAAANGLFGGNAGFTADPDADGTPNGLEWILGGDPNVSAAGIAPQVSLTPTQVILTFDRSDTTEPTSTLVAQWSTNLTTWNDVPVGATTSAGPNGTTVTVTENGTGADNIAVAFPRTLGVNGHLFVRLHATQP